MMMATLLHRDTPNNKSRFTRYLQYFRDVGPSYMVMDNDDDDDDDNDDG